RDREGRRARHRKEHRGGRAPVQQLRGDQPRRHGARAKDPRHCARRESRHHRPLGPDHAFSGGDGARRARYAAAWVHLPPTYRRSDDFARAHRGQDRAALREPHRVRARRVPVGVDLLQPALERLEPGICAVRSRRLRKDPHAARRQERADARAYSPSPGERSSHRLAGIRAVAPPGPRPPAPARLRSRRDRPLHRLVAVLPDLGPRGQLSEDPGGPGGRRGGALGVRRRAGDAGGDHRGEMADGERRVRTLSGSERGRRYRDLRRRIARGSGNGLARPAPGYPACPDHSEKAALFELLAAPQAGITLTETYAMLPASSVSGFYLSHPDSQYFAVDKIGEDQAADYARRKALALEQTERW